MTNLEKQIKAARAEAEKAVREYERLQKRREQLLAVKVRNEARRGRFVRRLDNDIRDAHKRLVMAEANLEGLIGTAEGQ